MSHPPRRTKRLAVVLLATASLATTTLLFAEEYKSGKVWAEPKKVDPGPAPEKPADVPSDAIVLFDGKDMTAWEGAESWEVADGAVTVGTQDIHTKQPFGDCQLHVEWATPAEVKGEGQGRGNSGIYLMGRYELQVLDSYDNQTYFDGQAGSIYKQVPPLVNASRKPGEWQTYDIVFHAPHFNDDGSVKTPATITAFHNGVLVQDHYALAGATFYDRPPSYTAHAEKEPLVLQSHHNPVRYRNVWVRELAPVKPVNE